MKNLILLILFNSIWGVGHCQNAPQWSFAIGNKIPNVGGPSAICADDDGNIYSVAGFGDSLIIQNIELPGGLFYLMKWDNQNTLAWAKSLGSSIVIKATVFSPDGYVYLTGIFSDSVIVDGVYYSSNGLSQGVVVIKIEKSGTVKWVKTGGGVYLEDMYFTGGIAVHPDGGVVLAGETSSPSLTFGSTTITNSAIARAGGFQSGMFAVRYNSNGDVLWARSDGKCEEIKAYGVAVDNLGRSFVTGFFKDSATINGSQYATATPGGTESYIIRYSKQGTIDWVKQFDAQFSFFIATAQSGEIYTHTYGLNLYKFDSLGSLLWLRQFNGQQSGSFPSDLKVDPSGNAYITAGFRDIVVFNGDTVIQQSKAHGSVYILKVKPDGSVAWAKTPTSRSGGLSSPKICLSKSDVYCVGTYQDTTEIAGYPLPYYIIPGQFRNSNYFFARLSNATSLPGEEDSKSAGFSIFPNPSSKLINVSLPAPTTLQLAVSLVDVSGRLIKRHYFTPGSESIQIPISGMSAGMYYISVSGLGTRKVVIMP